MYKLVVLFSVVALAAAKPGLVAPLAYGGLAPLAYSGVSPLAYNGVSPLAYGGVVAPAVSSVSQYSSSVVHPSPVLSYGVAPAVLPAVAPVALAQAPHSPAVVLDAVNGVPLDTPEVVAARAAHFQAKALSGLHHLRKRSVVGAPLAYSSVVSPVAAVPQLGYSSPVVSAYSAPVVSAYSAPLVSAYSSPVVSAYSSPVVSAYSSPLVSAYSSPLAYSAVGPRALSVHPW